MCKKLIYLVSFVLVLVAMPRVTNAQVENLMHTDPSFEDEIIVVSPGWGSWTTFGGGGSVEIDTDEFIDGAKSLRVNQTSGQFNVIAAAILMTPGERYTCSFWAKADAPRPYSVRFQSMNNSGWVAGDFDLTTEWAEYTFTEEAPNPNNNIKLQFITNDALGISYWLDFVYCYAGEYVAGIGPKTEREKAAKPNPADEATDLPRDVVLNWKPGEFANTHDVYLGTDFNDVNDASMGNQLDVMVVEGHDANSYDIGRLELGQTYFWRVDEVNAPPDTTVVFKGNVWSFTIEPVGYPVAGASITATASSQSTVDEDPNKTIDRSGLDGDGNHSQELNDMWLSVDSEPNEAWIRFDLDQVAKLSGMRVWNHNSPLESVVGYGIKEALIEYSLDGIAWSEFGIVELPQAGSADYQGIEISMDGIEAQSVRITAISNWSTLGVKQYGLSEVQLLAMPLAARELSPADGTENVDVLSTLMTWRAGREAASHNLYVSTDVNAVTDGTEPAVNVSEASYAPELDLGMTYFWRVDEVNDVEDPAVWAGGVQSFSAANSLVVDDFESYNDILPGEEGSNRIYDIWSDGYEQPANGSTIGYLIGASMEPDTVQGGDQSVPFSFDNTSASSSEVSVNPADLPNGSNWSIGSPTALVLWIYGDLGNTGNDQLYVKIGNSKFPYGGDLAIPKWRPVIVDLTGVSLSNVSTLAIGIERSDGTGGSGIVFIDEITLVASAPAVPSEEIWIEAENFVTITAPFEVLTELEGASGGQYIGKLNGSGDNSGASPNPDATATYTFEVLGGNYLIGLRVFGYGVSDGVWTRIADATAVLTENGADATLTDGWLDSNNWRPRGELWNWVNVVAGDNTGPADPDAVYTLTPGAHTLEIANRDDGTMLDMIVITSVD